MLKIGTATAFLIWTFSLSLNAQNISIQDIQGSGDVSPYNNTVVSTRGEVTGVYKDGYFIRESSAKRSGIYIYDPSKSPMPELGDTIQLTGLVTEYYNWTEIKNLTDFQVISSGNPEPVPVNLNTGDIGEDWESCLVTVTAASCTNPNLGYGEWEVNDGSGALVVNDLGVPYTPELDQEYEITGPVSFSFGAYKIEPRTLEDIEILAPVYSSKDLNAITIQKNSISLNWGTNSESTTEIFWGLTDELEQGYLSSPGTGTEHNITINGLQSAELIYVNAFSVFEEDTASSGLKTFITQSESSGEMRVSFNRTPVDASFRGDEDLFTDHLMDTLVFYIDQAETSLDLALYDFTNHAATGSNFENMVIDAINRASGRGVNVRLITDADVSGAITPNLNEIPVFEVNHDGIMHHKFIIIDHESASNAWLVTGSTNPNYNNMFLDFNNLIAIQDQSLAKAYLLEFNEIWGSDGITQDVENSRSGNEKLADSPHQFIIGGSEVELYFSPSDKTTTMISDQLAQAETSVEFAIMAFTENILGDAIVEAHDRGLEVKGIIDYVEFSGSEFDYLADEGVDVLDYKNPDGSGWPDGNTLHHKYAIVDAGTENASVITGSHNWTASAESINDENTLIIHNQDIADLFLQEFNRIRDWLMNPPVMPVCRNDVYEVSTFDEQVFEVTSNDDIEGDFQIEITRQPSFGNVSIIDNDILYTPGQDFNSGNDTILYKVSINSYPAFADSAMVIIVKEATGINSPTDIPGVFRVYPNPANDFINIYFTSEVAEPIAVEVRNVQGQTVIRRDDIYPGYPLRIVSRDFNPGIYIISLKTSMGDIHRRIIKE